MRRDDLLEVLRRRPFEAFRIHLTDGTTYDIRHPEFMLVSQTKAIVFFPPGDEPPPSFERYEHIALVHITRLVPLESTAIQTA